MTYYQLLLFIPACFALNMAPGPNNLMSLNNGRAFGFAAAMFGGLGRLSAFAVMIALAASGLAIVLQTSQVVFFVIKLVGAAYLMWLAFQLWTSKASPVQAVVDRSGLMNLFKQELFLAAGNPKAILIFTAFLPQFVDTTGDVNSQFFVLGALFLTLEIVAIAIYALLGIYLKNWFSKPAMARLFNRCCASFLAIAGGNLLLLNGKSSNTG